jgi:hypothetical protein
MPTMADTLALATAGGRVCPQPGEWQRLYDLLPNTRRQGDGWEPPLPLILSAWHFSEDWQRAARLREHLAWAEAQGRLDRVHAFLAALPDDAWHIAA